MRDLFSSFPYTPYTILKAYHPLTYTPSPAAAAVVVAFIPSAMAFMFYFHSALYFPCTYSAGYAFSGS